PLTDSAYSASKKTPLLNMTPSSISNERCPSVHDDHTCTPIGGFLRARANFEPLAPLVGRSSPLDGVKPPTPGTSTFCRAGHSSSCLYTQSSGIMVAGAVRSASMGARYALSSISTAWPMNASRTRSWAREVLRNSVTVDSMVALTGDVGWNFGA